MKNCLCCGNVLRSASAEKFGWHTSCIKNFFGTNAFPDIDISEDVLKQLALDSTNKGYTVPGVQKKLSLHLTEHPEPRLTLINYPTGYILKPQTDNFCALPEMEYLIMQMAVISGIKTVPFALVKLSSQDNAYAYITKRIDRDNGYFFAMEDFCQLDGRLTEDKYRGSYERCGKIVSQYSFSAGLDLTELFLRIVFSFSVGNSDMHLKNFSLIETAEGNAKYKLSAAYDMLSTNVVIPKDTEELALTLNGKKQNIRYKDFIIYADNIGLPPKTAERLIEKIAKLETKYTEMCNNSYMPNDMKNSLSNLIKQRIAVLTNKNVMR